MKKLLSFLSLSLFAITLFLGYSVTVNAETYDSSQFTAQLYDNYGPSLSAVTTDLVYGWEGKLPTMVANSSGGAWGISSPIALVEDHTYAMTVQITGTFGGNIILSTYDRIGIGSSLSSAKTSYEENTKVNEISSKAVGDGYSLQYVFTVTSTASYLVFPFATSESGSNWEFILNNIIIDDLGTDAVTQDEINTSLTNQTNILNSSIQNSTNTITESITETETNINSNIDDMESAIVDSNKETQDVIKDQFNSCRDSYNLLDFNKSFQTTNGLTITNNGDGSLTLNGTTTDIVSMSISDIMPNLDIGTYYFSINSSGSVSDKFTKIIYGRNSGTAVNLTSFSSITTNGLSFTTSYLYEEYYLYFYIPTGITFTNYVVKPMLNEGSTALEYEQYGEEICTNKLDEANETSKGIWETLKSIPSLILDGIKGLFVPSEEELQSLIDEFKATMETKLGAIYQVTDMLVDVFKSIFSPTERNSCITFPEIKDPMFDKLLIEQTDYCFDTLRTDFEFLFTISDMIISIVCTLAFGNMLYKKFEGFIGGDTSDY